MRESRWLMYRNKLVTCWQETYFSCKLQYSFIKRSSLLKLKSFALKTENWKDILLVYHVFLILKPHFSWMDGSQRQTFREYDWKHLRNQNERSRQHWSYMASWHTPTRFLKTLPWENAEERIYCAVVANHGLHTFNVAHKSFLHLYLIITTRNTRSMPLQQGRDTIPALSPWSPS